jgi:hypothetical protein
MTAILDFINAFFAGLYHIAQWCLDAVVTVLGVTIQIFFEGFLAIILAFVQGLDFGSLSVSLASSWGLLDYRVAWVLTQSGVPTGFSMLALAYGIRFSLNLIPSWLTRI